jgi:hypothetical protein
MVINQEGETAVEKGEESPGIVIGPHDLACAIAAEQALVEREIARLSCDGRRLASRILGRIVEIEAEWGAEVAEAVVEGVIDILRGRRRLLS